MNRSSAECRDLFSPDETSLRAASAWTCAIITLVSSLQLNVSANGPVTVHGRLDLNGDTYVPPMFNHDNPIVLAPGDLGWYARDESEIGVPFPSWVSHSAALHPLFEVAPGAILTLRALTLEGGLAPRGGAVFVGEGGTLIAHRVVFTKNTALRGGAVYADYGTALEFSWCRFVENWASWESGAVSVDANATLTFDASIAERNLAGFGAAFVGINFFTRTTEFYGISVKVLSSEPTSVRLVDCELTDNRAVARVAAAVEAMQAKVSVVNTKISGARAGGVAVSGANATLDMRNVTLSTVSYNETTPDSGELVDMGFNDVEQATITNLRVANGASAYVRDARIFSTSAATDALLSTSDAGAVVVIDSLLSFEKIAISLSGPGEHRHETPVPSALLLRVAFGNQTFFDEGEPRVTTSDHAVVAIVNSVVERNSVYAPTGSVLGCSDLFGDDQSPQFYERELDGCECHDRFFAGSRRSHAGVLCIWPTDRDMMYHWPTPAPTSQMLANTFNSRERFLRPDLIVAIGLGVVLLLAVLLRWRRCKAASHEPRARHGYELMHVNDSNEGACASSADEAERGGSHEGDGTGGDGDYDSDTRAERKGPQVEREANVLPTFVRFLRTSAAPAFVVNRNLELLQWSEGMVHATTVDPALGTTVDALPFAAQMDRGLVTSVLTRVFEKYVDDGQSVRSEPMSVHIQARHGGSVAVGMTVTPFNISSIGLCAVALGREIDDPGLLRLSFSSQRPPVSPSLSAASRTRSSSSPRATASQNIYKSRRPSSPALSSRASESQAAESQAANSLASESRASSSRITGERYHRENPDAAYVDWAMQIRGLAPLQGAAVARLAGHALQREARAGWDTGEAARRFSRRALHGDEDDLLNYARTPTSSIYGERPGLRDSARGSMSDRTTPSVSECGDAVDWAGRHMDWLVEAHHNSAASRIQTAVRHTLLPRLRWRKQYMTAQWVGRGMLPRSQLLAISRFAS